MTLDKSRRASLARVMLPLSLKVINGVPESEMVRSPEPLQSTGDSGGVGDVGSSSNDEAVVGG